MNVFSFVQWNKYFHSEKDEMLHSTRRTFHLLPHENTCTSAIDIHGRSQTTYTGPCKGIVSHGAQIGGLRVFTDHIRKNKRNKNASTILARRAAFYACLYLHTAVDAGDIRT